MVEIIGPILEIEKIASGRSIRNVGRLIKVYGPGRWRKLKGIGRIKIGDKILTAEVHWYEAHGIGRKEIKIKRIID
jgi:hypothetical protein